MLTRIIPKIQNAKKAYKISSILNSRENPLDSSKYLQHQETKNISVVPL